jgi:hypothetical protein
MLVGSWYGVMCRIFCIAFAVVIAVFIVLAHLFYYHNIEVSPEDVDADGNVDPNVVPSKVQDKGGNLDFKWSEVWEIISSHELLMLAFF